MSRTARQLTAEELGAFEPRARLAALGTDAAREERRRIAWAAAREAAALLRRSYLAQRVVVFGSLASPERFTRFSDLDLAVSGVPPRLFYDAAGEALDLGRRFGVGIDVVDLDACPPEFRRAIEAEGLDL